MSSVYKLLIQILGKDQASDDLKRVQKNVTGLSTAASAMGKVMQAAGALGIAYVGRQALEAVWDLGELGAESLRLKDAFQDLAGAASDDLLRAIQDAAGGTVSEMDAMAAANRGILLGMGTDIQQWADLTEVARFRARAMGIDVTQAISDIATGIGRESRLILDNLGIILDMDQVMKDYADTLGRTSDELTAAERKQAMMNAVIADGQKMIAEAGGITDDYKDNIEALNASVDNLKVSIGELVAPTIADLATELYAVSEAIQGNVQPMEELTQKTRDARKEFEEATGRVGHMGEAFREVVRAAEPYAAAIQESNLAMKVASAAVGEASTAMGRYASVTYEARREALQLRPAVEDLEDAFNDLAVGVWAGTYAQLQAIEVYEYRREGIVRKTEDDVERLKQINESFLDDLKRKTNTTLDDTGRAWDDLRSTIESALQPTQVTALDMAQTAAGTYEEKWDEAARQLDAIAARGFAELEAHPDWAGILKIPPEVLAGTDEGLRAWADKTADDVRNLLRPDLLLDNMDAIVQQVQNYLNQQAAKELSLDLITEAVMKEGIITGEDAKKKVAAALGIDQTYIGEEMGTQLIGGLMASLGDTSVSIEFASYMQKDVSDSKKDLKDSGTALWQVVEIGIMDAMLATDYALEFARILAPYVAKELQEMQERTGQ